MPMSQGTNPVDASTTEAAGARVQSAGETAVRSAAPAPKVIVLIPAGEVYDTDHVRWYAHDNPSADLQHNYNAGDMFVYEASLKLLSFASLEFVPLKSDLDQSTIDRINREADYCFIRGSNYIHKAMNWGDLPTVLDRINLPIIAFGIGAQAASYGPVEVSADTRRVLDIVADRSTVIGVRGSFTADILNAWGIKNTEVIGCPSLMRHNKPLLEFQLGRFDDLRRLGFTLTRGLEPIYCQDPPKARQMQRQLILELSDRYDLTIMSQGELPEKTYWYRNEDLIPEAYDKLVKDKWFIGPEDPMIKLYQNCLFFGRSPVEYETLVKSLDCVLGFRLHGNIMALANQVPAVYVVYDTRTRELVEALHIPAHDLSAPEPFDFEAYYDQASFDRFAAQYRVMYQRMARFLDKNGCPHRMQHAVIQASAA